MRAQKKSAPRPQEPEVQDRYDYQDGYYLEEEPRRRGLWWKILLLILLAGVLVLCVWCFVSPDFPIFLSELKKNAGQFLRSAYEKLSAVF